MDTDQIPDVPNPYENILKGEEHLYSEPPPSIHPLSQRCLSHMQHGRIILGRKDPLKSDRPDDGPADFIVSR